MINWDHFFNCSTMHEKIHSEMKWSLTTGFECMFCTKIEKNLRCNNTPSEYTRLYEKIQNAMFTKYTRLAHHKTQFKLNFRIAIKFAQIHQNFVKQSICYVQLFKLPKIEIKNPIPKPTLIGSNISTAIPQPIRNFEDSVQILLRSGNLT